MTILHDLESEDGKPVAVGTGTPPCYGGWFPVARPPGKMFMHCQHGPCTYETQGSVMANLKRLHIFWNSKCWEKILCWYYSSCISRQQEDFSSLSSIVCF